MPNHVTTTVKMSGPADVLDVRGGTITNVWGGTITNVGEYATLDKSAKAHVAKKASR